jgi:lipoate-protein ligase A
MKLDAFFTQLSWWDDLAPRPPGLNMAIDQLLLEKVRFPLLRRYRWDRPCVSFGYFGRVAEVQTLVGDRPLVRRWTGGGVVWHGEDFTYSLIVPATESLGQQSAADTYRVLHRSLASFLETHGIITDLAPVGSDAPSTMACFTHPVAADVIMSGKKIAGAALRRTQQGFLAQGSIQGVSLPADFFSQWARSMAQSGDVDDFQFPIGWLVEAEAIASRCYDHVEWREKR